MKRDRQGRAAVLPTTLVALLALGACGGGGTSDGDGGPDDGTRGGGRTAAAELEPQVAWADEMCAAVARTSVALTPPTIDEQDVAGTLQALVDMFGTMADQLGDQRVQLREVGPPPEGGERAFRVALRHLSEAQGVAQRVERSLSRSSQTPPQDLRSAFRATGGLEVGGEEYLGFVLDLVGQDQDLLPAIAEAPSCADVATS